MPLLFSACHSCTARFTRTKAIWQTLLLILLCSIGANSHANSLSATVDRDTLNIQETFTLTLRYGGKTDEMPDLTALRRDFEIISANTNQMEITINFNREIYTDWTLLLAPKKSGVFTIPAIEFAGQTSRAILMTIKNDKTNSNLFTTTEINKNTAYVQEQILLTIRLYTAVGLDDIGLDPLEIKDAVVIPLEQKQFNTTHDGRQHLVVETVFAVFPQISGTLTIPSLSYNALVSSNRRGLFSQMMGGQNNLVRLRTEEKNIAVNATPATFSGKPWLPAKNISLSEHWSHSLDSIKVGEPITRSITIIADGLSAGQITPITLQEMEGLTFYPDKAQTDEQKTPQGVIGTRIETFAIVANRSGHYTLPAVSIDWWDTVNQKMQTAQLPETTIEVVENPFVTDNNPTTPNTAVAILPEKIPTTIPYTEPQTPKTPTWLYGFMALLLLIVTVLAILYWRAKRELSAIYATDQKSDAHQQLQESNSWRELKQANAAADFIGLRKAVLSWAQIHWQDNNIHSLQQIAERTDSIELRQQLNYLDQALYGDKKNGWDSGELLQQIHACKKQKRDQGRVQLGLKPLYKN